MENKNKSGIFKKIIPAVIFGVVYAALILFGWGLDDIGGFFSHPARTILFGVTISVNTLTMLFKDKFGVEFNKKGEKKDTKEIITGVVLPTLMMRLAAFPQKPNIIRLFIQNRVFLGDIIYIPNNHTLVRAT